jgi:DNA-binding CsgD family transcriptional regulator
MADDPSDATRLQDRTSDRQGIEVLIRWLLAELSAMGITVAPRHDLLNGTGREEIVLDVEIDGEGWCLTHYVVEAVRDSPPTLSPREHEIARMVAKGYANKSIASVLDISSWTVSSHLRRIYAKFGVSSRAAMVARLLEDNRSSGNPSHRQPLTPVRPPTPSLHGPHR